MRITKSTQHIEEVQAALDQLKSQIIGELARFKIYALNSALKAGVDKEPAIKIVNIKAAEMREKMAERYKALEDTLCLLKGVTLKHNTTPEDRILELTAEITAREFILKRAVSDKWDFVSTDGLKRKLTLWRELKDSFETVEPESDNQTQLTLNG